MKDLSARLRQIGVTGAGQVSGGMANAGAARRDAAPPSACFVRETALPLADIAGLDALPPETMRRIDAGFAERYGTRLPGIRRLLFLDTETTGLGMGAGTVAFLLGLGWVEGDAFIVRQLLMRDYPEEPLLLNAFAELLPRFDAFVTYNGKTFDLPLLENRLTMHRMRGLTLDLPHLDLLYPARRVWKMRLADCTLGNVERCVLDFAREGDLSGSEVPQRFFAYLKTREFALLEDVLHHNLIDIQTLGRLLVRLVQVFETPEQQSFAEDVFSVGRALDRTGEREAARACFRAVGERAVVAERSRVLLAHSHRRDRQFEEAGTVYREMIARGEGGVAPYIELAKIAEHRQGDLFAALRYTEAALERLALRERLGRVPDAEESAALHLRRARLLRKLQSIKPHSE